MRSRWLADQLPAAAGAAAEGVWAGALAALVTGGSGAAYMAGAAGATFGGALLAAGTGAGREPGRRARSAAAGLTAAVAAAYFVAARGWAGGQPVVAAVGALVYAALLVYLGISLGREPISADAAFRRATRAFLLLCGVLAIAAIAGSAPAWAPAAVAVSLVTGAVSVAAARARSLGGSAGLGDLATTWRWLLAVAGILLLVVGVGAVLAALLRVDVLLWALAVAGDLLRYLLGLLGFVLGWAGAGLLRALAWLLGLFHLHSLPTVEPPKSTPAHLKAVPKSPGNGVYTWTRVGFTVAAAVVAVVVPLLLVAFALRRVRGTLPTDVAEERETVLTLRQAGGDAAARVRRRLARLGPHRRLPATPAEAVRHEYEDLERRMARSGYPRPAASTVRAYLRALAEEHEEEAGAGASDAAAGSDAQDPTGRREPPSAELARLYELARYSAGGVGEDAVPRFRELAHAFPVPGTG